MDLFIKFLYVWMYSPCAAIMPNRVNIIQQIDSVMCYITYSSSQHEKISFYLELKAIVAALFAEC